MRNNILVLLSIATSAWSFPVPLGLISIQMSSRSPSTANDLIMDVITATSVVCDDALTQAYLSTPYRFDQTRFAHDSYAIDSTSGGYTASMELEGTAWFQDNDGNDDDMDESEVQAIVEAALSDNASFLTVLANINNPFLQDVVYAIVTVDGTVVSQGGQVQAAKSSSSQAQAQSTNTDVWDTWMIALLAGAAAFCMVLCACVLCICLLQPAADDDDEEDHHKKIVIKASNGSGASTAPEDDEELPPPSPVRSITSQDSSKFTYNPGTYTGTYADARTLPSVMSATTATTMDVDAWTNAPTKSIGKSSGTASVVTMGLDLSVIEPKKDLSLIQEEDDEDVTPAKQQSEPRLSTKNLADLERGERRQSRVSRKSNSNKNSRSSKSSRSSSNKLDLNGTAQDVISDLKDLSFQIDRYRGSSSNRR